MKPNNDSLVVGAFDNVSAARARQQGYNSTSAAPARTCICGTSGARRDLDERTNRYNPCTKRQTDSLVTSRPGRVKLALHTRFTARSDDTSTKYSNHDLDNVVRMSITNNKEGVSHSKCGVTDSLRFAWTFQLYSNHDLDNVVRMSITNNKEGVSHSKCGVTDSLRFAWTFQLYSNHDLDNVVRMSITNNKEGVSHSKCCVPDSLRLHGHFRSIATCISMSHVTLTKDCTQLYSNYDLDNVVNMSITNNKEGVSHSKCDVTDSLRLHGHFRSIATCITMSHVTLSNDCTQLYSNHNLDNVVRMSITNNKEGVSHSKCDVTGSLRLHGHFRSIATCISMSHVTLTKDCTQLYSNHDLDNVVRMSITNNKEGVSHSKCDVTGSLRLHISGL
ncbi:hypothetical protein J6590_020322 [Homalodisca vitripennis]|nr:hypothetical protein J6590_020322 [Homalodisca vitripennis]